jgi:hypothetical protein
MSKGKIFYSPLLNYLFTGHNIVEQKGSSTPMFFQIQTWRGYYEQRGKPAFRQTHGGARPKSKAKAIEEGEEDDGEEEAEKEGGEKKKEKVEDTLEKWGPEGATFLTECFRNMTDFQEFPSSDYRTGTPAAYINNAMKVENRHAFRLAIELATCDDATFALYEGIWTDWIKLGPLVVGTPESPKGEKNLDYTQVILPTTDDCMDLMYKSFAYYCLLHRDPSGSRNGYHRLRRPARVSLWSRVSDSIISRGRLLHRCGISSP